MNTYVTLTLKFNLKLQEVSLLYIKHKISHIFETIWDIKPKFWHKIGNHLL